MKDRWEMTPEYKDAILRRLMRIVIDPASSNREATAACKALMNAEKQNQDDDKSESIDGVIEQSRNRFLALANRLGIRQDSDSVIDVRARSNRDSVDSERPRDGVDGEGEAT